MGRRSIALVGALLLAGVLLAPTALACKEDVSLARSYLSRLTRDAHKARSSDRLRVLALLKDGEVTLDSARKDCDAATSFAERALASAKVAAARVSLSAADALIPDN